MAVQQQHVARGFSVPDATALLEATASVGPVPHSAIFTEPLASPTLPSPSSLLSHSPTSQSPPAMLGPTAPEDLPSPTTDPSGPTQEDLGSNKEPRSPSRLILGDEVIDEFIDYDLVYARHTFVASLEGQVCVFKSDSLELLDDTNSYWWLVKCIKTDEIGYIPAENIETPHERLARLNSFRNVQLALPSKSDLHNVPLPLIPRRNIRFNEVPSVCEDYDKDYYDSDDAEEEETVDGEPPIDSTDDAISPTAQSKAVFVKSESPSLDRQSVSSDPPYTSPVGKSRRVSSMTLGQNLFQKFIRRSGSKVDRADRNRLSLVVSDSLDRTRGKQAGTVLPSSSVHSKVLPNSVQSPNGSLTSPAGSPASSPLPSKAASPESAALNVLRIYAGNVDLKATFKTVSLSKTMSAIDLLEQALRRFRVTGTVEEYYLSVIHMDSLERRFTDTENVSETLEMLRQKHLPGVGFNSSSKMAAGPTSPIHASDDNFIKVIINKKLNLYEKKYHLVRIFICDEQDPLVRTYKTLGISPDATVRDIIGIAVKKFKLNANEPGFTLTSLFGDKEVVRQDDENISDILAAISQGAPEDIGFLLGKLPTGVPESDGQSELAVGDIEESPSLNSVSTMKASPPENGQSQLEIGTEIGTEKDPSISPLASPHMVPESATSPSNSTVNEGDRALHLEMQEKGHRQPHYDKDSPTGSSEKQSFGAMEAFLEEIMKEHLDLPTMEKLEGALIKAQSPSKVGHQSLHESIRSLGRHQSSLPRTDTPDSSVPSLTPSSAPSTLLRSQQSLKDVYSDLERDLEGLAMASAASPTNARRMSTATSHSPRHHSPSPLSLQDARSDTLQQGTEERVTPPPNHIDQATQHRRTPSGSTRSSTVIAPGSAGSPSNYPLTLAKQVAEVAYSALPPSARPSRRLSRNSSVNESILSLRRASFASKSAFGEFDPALDRFVEVDAVLTALEKDLDLICAKAVSLLIDDSGKSHS